MKTRRRGGKVLNVKRTIRRLNRSRVQASRFCVAVRLCHGVRLCTCVNSQEYRWDESDVRVWKLWSVCLHKEETNKKKPRGKKKALLWFFRPNGRTKQTGAYCRGSTLTVTSLDLFELRVLSAWLINTSFSFNGAGASRQPSKALFIWVIYVFPRGAPWGRGICPHRCTPQHLKARGKLIGLSLKNK